jgi:hypothetical protein
MTCPLCAWSSLGYGTTTAPCSGRFLCGLPSLLLAIHQKHVGVSGWCDARDSAFIQSVRRRSAQHVRVEWDFSPPRGSARHQPAPLIVSPLLIVRPSKISGFPGTATALLPS